MKKILIRVSILIVVILVVGYFMMVPRIVSMVTDYDRVTHEDVFESPEKQKHFGIGGAKSPVDYGFENFEEVNYTALYDGLNLNGWYIPSTGKDIDRCLLIIHGRTSNRLKTMKYLEIIKDYGLDSLYHVFVPDLRNSGKSDESATAMGYRFSEDIASSLKMLKTKFDHRHFVLYGFSMGSMASATYMNRVDLQKEMAKEAIAVDKLILASPLSNVKATLKFSSENMGIPDFLFEAAYGKFNRAVDGYGDQMKFSHLLSHNKVPTLILYGDADDTTPHTILEKEMEGLTHIRAEKFSGTGHVKIYTQPEYKERYAQSINEFLRN